MKKLTFILLISLAFVSTDIIAQWTNSGSGRINRTGGADRTSDGSGIYATQGDWSTDAMISQYTSTQTLASPLSWEGTSHSGMGASGWGSTAMGAYNRASGTGAFVAGYMNVAGPTASNITAIPPSTTNLGGQFAVGYATAATGHTAFTSGYSTIASGNYSTAMGIGATATDHGSFVIGSYNSSGSSATSATSFSTSAPAFVIGNGTASNAKSDAFKVVFNGDTTMAGDLTVTGNDITFGNGETVSNGTDGTLALTASTTTMSGDLTVTGNDLHFGNGESISNASDGTVTITSGTVAITTDATIGNDLTVSGDVVVSSDARLKSNIVSLGSTLSRLLLIDGKSYTMLKDGKQKIGVLAQEIKEVFPELVSEDANEMLAVNYQGLVPVLINALKEQDDKISRLENLVEKLIADK